MRCTEGKNPYAIDVICRVQQRVRKALPRRKLSGMRSQRWQNLGQTLEKG